MKGEKFNIPDNKLRVLVAPLDWGLGHATRCIPIIFKLLQQNCEVIIAAEGMGKILLQKEFPNLIFIERADDGHVHSGQIALPGGKVEQHDKDLLATALRETKEEIGIDAKEINVLGK